MLEFLCCPICGTELREIYLEVSAKLRIMGVCINDHVAEQENIQIRMTTCIEEIGAMN